MNIKGSRITMRCTRTAEPLRASVPSLRSAAGERDRARLRRLYGPGRWRKRKGVVLVRLPDGVVTIAEDHWYEASGIGKKELKVKRLFWD